MSDVTMRIASFVMKSRNYYSDKLSAGAVPHLLDTLAVTLAGRADPQFRLLEQSLDLGAECGAYGASDQALLNGFASHVLDYDDVSMLAVCHPSAPVLSAMLAWSTSRLNSSSPISGQKFVAAYCIGVETLVRTGQAMGFDHYRLGFHPTATLGPLGAVTALSVLADFDEKQCSMAIGIAASMSAGLKKNFGTSVKSLHVGSAAANGLRAMRMAASGLDASASPLEAGGFLHAFSGGNIDHWPQHLQLGEPFAILEPGFESKRYPCCYMLHKVIEAVLTLRRESPDLARTWERAVVRLPTGALQALIHPYPRTGLEAKFSTPYVVVAGLLDGHIDLASFDETAVMRQQVQTRLHDITVEETGAASKQGGDIGKAAVEVELFWPDGSTSVRRVINSPGSPEDPMTPEQRMDKWIDCLRVGRPDLSAIKARELAEYGNTFASLPDVKPFLLQLLHMPG